MATAYASSFFARISRQTPSISRGRSAKARLPAS